MPAKSSARALPVLAAGLMGLFILGFYRLEQLGAPFRLYGQDNANRQSPGEGGFWLGFAVFGSVIALGCAGLLYRTLSDRLERLVQAAERRPQAVTLLFAAAALALAASLSGLAFWHQNFTDDEYAYLFTARLLRQGHLTAPLWLPETAFRYRFLTEHAGRHFSVYGVVHPALLVPGLLLGVPQLGVHVLVAVTVLASAGLARELYGDRTAIYVAAVVALSPFLLATGATLHNAVSSTALCALFLWFFTRFERRLAVREALYAGLALALALHVRPLDTLGYAVPVALYALGRLAVGPSRGARLLGYAALSSCVLAGVGTYLLLNAHLTGSMRTTAFELFNQREWRGTKLFGFDPQPVRLYTSTPEVAFSRLITQVSRGHFWMFGWPLGVLPALGARGRTALALATIPLLLVGGYFYYYSNSVADTGPVYYLCALPVVAVLAVRGLETLAGRLGTAAPAAALCGLVIAGGALFAPRELAAAREVARTVRRPKRAVERAGLHDALVLVERPHPIGSTPNWVFSYPIPGQPLEAEDVIWVPDQGTGNAILTRQFPGRRVVRLRWQGPEPTLEPLVPP
ncbi:MAG TPA: hypothetical protein VKN99_10760 [Polyangia bacterium]|nr:hypothetical protein [Polyangia bacterium]